MTELETLFFKDQYSLRLDIGNAIYEDDTTALANYRREFSFEHDFTARVSIPSIQSGTLTLDSKEELDAVVNGDWSWDYNKYESEDEDTDYCSYECEKHGVIAYGLKLLNPSPEAQETLRKKVQDQKAEKISCKVWTAVASVLRTTTGDKNWTLAEKQFLQEKTEELTKALLALN